MTLYLRKALPFVCFGVPSCCIPPITILPQKGSARHFVNRSYLERAIAESEFREYVVDVEYNRGSRGNEYAAKVLNGHNIVVDLVVHKRGYDEQRGFDNLFCIEMKKAYKRCDLSSDKERLRILTDDFLGFGYKAGFMITATADIFHDEYKLVVESYFYNRSEE